jgi:uncharacterized membrane protein YbhN (UPF0104 family)
VLRFDAELAPVVERIERANPSLLIPALALEALSFGGYVVLFRAMLEGHAPWLGSRAITRLTFANVVATRLLAAGGTGGIALTAWALDAAGLGARESAGRIVAFLVVLYSLFVGPLALSAITLLAGLLGARAPTALALAGLARRSPSREWRSPRSRARRRRERRRARRRPLGAAGSARRGRLATVPAVAGEASRLALRLVCARFSILLFALAWRARSTLAVPSLLRRLGARAGADGRYFLGHVGNLLPMPGGVGGVEGGTIACFVACGVPLSLALAATVAHQLCLDLAAGARGARGSPPRLAARWRWKAAGSDRSRRPIARSLDRPSRRARAGSPSPDPTTPDPSRVR